MFSVVIPLFNKGHTVIETIESVLAQDFEDFELVVVDDGSTDDGPQKIRDRFGDARIRLIHQENLGVSAARNRGVEVARHELIAFLDGDDHWRPGYLTAMKAAADLFPEAGMYCCAGVQRFPGGGGYVRHDKRYGQTPRKVDYFENPDFFNHTSSTVVRKQAFAAAGGFDPRMRQFEDLTLWQLLALQTEVVYCPVPLVTYQKGVRGQASADRSPNHDSDGVRRLNLPFARWAAGDPADRHDQFLVNARRELRIRLATLIAADDYDGVGHLMRNVDPRLIAELTGVERAMYPVPALKYPSIARIRLANLWWRTRRHPRPRYSRDVGSALS